MQDLEREEDSLINALEKVLSDEENVEGDENLENPENVSANQPVLSGEELELLLSILRDEIAEGGQRGAKEGFKYNPSNTFTSGFLPDRYSWPKKRRGFFTGAMEPLSSGFLKAKKGFYSGAMEPLASGFTKKGFNEGAMEPLASGFFKRGFHYGGEENVLQNAGENTGNDMS